ncbi:2Fe-2S iron-sulfur cluster-binding protein [Noviherbaspirillum suwonense]|uniref:Xanthine dehydrogenase YagT iron-sulfur-binding subunit n=1 Tax=Noviherbaspirillum suwonense TaxID=1224511 RepID=A0ABY1Q399_9BURK|nr:2Fe-2S iron-sulfur cluster-binding protein [Noviherbaspirillum suwonense]SMP57017.1 xanthine dehydrogenase YagT iron-sulfur-binding subunit [Noviherbaspirillum suwonense]
MQNDSSDSGSRKAHPGHSAPDPDLDSDSGSHPSPASISRRGFIQATVATLGGIAAPLGAADAAPAARPAGTAAAAANAMPVVLRINGKEHRLTLEPRVTLLDALREVVGLTGSKKGCDRGQCGACTVLVEGRRINACLTLAVMHEGQEITTIEGLGQADALHPLQAAFIERDAFQCGYCTPGQICSAVGLLKEAAANTASAVTPDVRKIPVVLDDSEIRERMSGNICRCGAYPNIVAAVRDVAGNKA